MDFNTIMQLISLGTDHKWLALAVVVIGWITSMTSDWSKFPITVPGRYQPFVAGLLGVAYSTAMALAPAPYGNGTGVWSWSIVGHGLVVGLCTVGMYEAIIKAVFNGVVPSWLAWLSWKNTPGPIDTKISQAERVEAAKKPSDRPTPPAPEPESGETKKENPS